ncbi:MAG: B12-binding domain-containing radical SAM protein [bacterium]
MAERLVLINTNLMQPPIAPIGLDYMATAVRRAGIETEIADLCLAADPKKILEQVFAHGSPHLVGLSFRNLDDSFWPSAQSFMPDLIDIHKTLRQLTDAPIAIGGVGFSMFPEQTLEATGADFGIRGDGEEAIIALMREIEGSQRFDRVPGLIFRHNRKIESNPPTWPGNMNIPTTRDAIDNAAYFKRGGQIGLETKRGCHRKCIYCADPLAKGHRVRCRDPIEVADEFESLLKQEIDVFHTCDCEFNIDYDHALAVCHELINRKLGSRIRWYAYLAVTPFDTALAGAMAKAGCVGINFTGDAGSAGMLRRYAQSHGPEDLARSVGLCRQHKITVMVDLLLGGPGETPETLAETIGFIKMIDPDCAGAALGVRLYPNTEMAHLVYAEGPPESNTAIRRKYRGPIDLFKPTFYISRSLGDQPARLVRELIGGDPRFFEPILESDGPADRESGDHNYNHHTALVQAIADGARGAYWDILRRLPKG